MTDKERIEHIRLDKLFDDLQENAYDSIWHKYFYKEANQIIRKHFEGYRDILLFDLKKQNHRLKKEIHKSLDKR